MRLEHHIELLAKPRTLALRDCVFRSVKKGDRVLDAGTGSGILAVWAAMAGAESVVAVDREHSGLAMELALANGVASRVNFIACDLEQYMPREKFDGICAMIYENDPRRDEAAHDITRNLASSYLKPDGWLIPSEVHYLARLVDWPTFDWPTESQCLSLLLDTLSLQLKTDLSPLSARLRDVPLMRLFPRRLPNGSLEGRPLSCSDDQEVFKIDYLGGPVLYPETVDLVAHRSGNVNALVWTQQIFAGRQLLFSNESISWLHIPCQVAPGQSVKLDLDAEWRQNNTLTAALD